MQNSPSGCSGITKDDCQHLLGVLNDVQLDFVRNRVERRVFEVDDGALFDRLVYFLAPFGRGRTQFFEGIAECLCEYVNEYPAQ